MNKLNFFSPIFSVCAILIISGCVFFTEEKKDVQKEIQNETISQSINYAEKFNEFMMSHAGISPEMIQNSKEYREYLDNIFFELIDHPSDQEKLQELNILISMTNKYASAHTYGEIILNINRAIDNFFINNLQDLNLDSAFEKELEREVIINQLAAIKTFINPYGKDQDDLVWSVQKNYCMFIKEKLRKLNYELKIDCEAKIKEYDRTVSKNVDEQNIALAEELKPLLEEIKKRGGAGEIKNADDIRKIGAYIKIIKEYIPNTINKRYEEIIDKKEASRLYNRELKNMTRLIKIAAFGEEKANAMSDMDSESRHIFFDLEEGTPETWAERMKEADAYIDWTKENFMDPFRKFIADNPEIKNDPKKIDRLLFDPRKGILFRIFLMRYESENYEEGKGTKRPSDEIIKKIYDQETQYYNEVLSLVNKKEENVNQEVKKFFNYQDEDVYINELMDNYNNLKQKYGLGEYLMNEFVAGFFMEKQEQAFRKEILEISVNREEALNDFANLRMKFLALIFLETKKYEREINLAMRVGDEMQMWFDFSFFFIDPEKKWDGEWLEASGR